MPTHAPEKIPNRVRTGLSWPAPPSWSGLSGALSALALLVATTTLAVAEPPAGATAGGDSDRLNVLLLTFDTTRADFIGCYGRQNARTPQLDRLAAEGALFEKAFSSNPITQPAHSTILTGVYPMVHGVRDNSMFKLPEERSTLAEIMKDAGYATGAAIGGFPLVREFGLAQGFDFYDDDITGNREDFRGRADRRQGGTWYDERPAGHVNDAILPWLRENINDPFFVWLHYWDPHLPHIAPAPYGEVYAHDPYQGEIAYADESLGTILAELKEAGVYDRTIVVMTSDHGEGRDEHHEATHAYLAYGTTLHVPLIVKAPGIGNGRRIDQSVGTVDIVPTVLDLVGVDGPPELQGRSLAGLIRDGETEDGEAPPLYYSESISPRLSHGVAELRVLYDWPLKYIYGPRPELFDVTADPGELDDLVASRPEDSRRMEAALATFIHERANAEAANAAHEVDEATRARLEALGYLDSSDDETPQAVEEVLMEGGIAPQDRVGDINLSQRLRQQIGAGRFAAAARTARTLLEGSPDSVFYSAQLAQALIGQDDVAGAADVLDGLADLGGAHQQTFLGVAYAVFDGGERDRGRALAAKAAEAEDTVEARVTLARMAFDGGDDDAFEEEIQRALEIDPDHQQALHMLAKQRLARGKLSEAAETVRGILTTQPSDAVAHLRWAELLRRNGRADMALERAERSLRLGGQSCDGALEKLRILIALERTEEAARQKRSIDRDCRDEEWRTEAGALLASE